MEIVTDFGKCSYDFEEDYCHIHSLYVNPPERNKGNATKLLKQVIQEIKQLGWDKDIEIVCLPTEKEIDKKRLTRFYKSLGLKVFEYYG